jgi:hypothetical protein
MSLVRLNRSLAQHRRKMADQSGAMVGEIGEQIGGLATAFGVTTEPNKEAKKSVEAGAKEAGVEMPKKSLKLFDRTPFKKKESGIGYSSDIKGLNKNFFKNWAEKLNLKETDVGTLTNKDGKSYDTGDLAALGRIRRSKSPLLHMQVKEYERGGKKLTDLVGTAPSPPPPSEPIQSPAATPTTAEPSPVEGQTSVARPELIEGGFNALKNKMAKPMSSILQSDEFKNGTLDDRSAQLNSSTGNDINTTGVVGTTDNPDEDEFHPWRRGMNNLNDGFAE